MNRQKIKSFFNIFPSEKDDMHTKNVIDDTYVKLLFQAK